MRNYTTIAIRALLRRAKVALGSQTTQATIQEEAIVASYRRRYSELDPDQKDLVAKLSAFSVAACLASEH